MKVISRLRSASRPPRRRSWTSWSGRRRRGRGPQPVEERLRPGVPARERHRRSGGAHRGARADQYRVAQANEESIRACDMVLAVLDGVDVDSGTASEMGFAFALGKRVHGLRTDYPPDRRQRGQRRQPASRSTGSKRAAAGIGAAAGGCAWRSPVTSREYQSSGAPLLVTCYSQCRLVTYRRRRRGSSASRRPSPIRLKARTVRKIARPGKRVSHHAPYSSSAGRPGACCPRRASGSARRGRDSESAASSRMA